MEIFKLLRNSSNMTQDHLARKLSVDQQTIASYEAGRSIPSFKVFLKILKVFNVSFDFLIRIDKTPYPKNLKLLRMASELDNPAFTDGRNNLETTARSLLGKRLNTQVNLKQDNISCELNTHFNINLKESRKFRKLTQLQLAAKIGVSRNLLAQYELKKYPPIERLIGISTVLDISIHALATGQKLIFNFKDAHFANTMLLADQFLSLDEHKMLIHLMEAILNKNKT